MSGSHSQWQPSAWAFTVAAECDEAKARLQALTMFVGSPAWQELPWRHRSLLLRQVVIMGEYVQVLEERLEEITA